MRRRKTSRAALPRVTVLSYNRKELVAFVNAVELLRMLVADLTDLLSELRAKTARKRPARPKDNGQEGGGSAAGP